MTLSPLALALVSVCFALACGSAEHAAESAGSGGVSSASATSAGGASTSTASASSGGSDAASAASGGAATSTSTATSQSSASSGGSGAAASSSTTSADGACAGQPVHCIELCEAGTCQCDCSASSGCTTPGWVESSLSWERFGLADQAGAGLTLCHPDTFTWSDPELSANSPSLNGSPHVNFLAYARTDHVNALRYLGDQDAAKCSYELLDDYGVRFLNVDGWTAMEQSYVEPAPVCGACDVPPDPHFNAVANFYLAAGSLVLMAQAVAATESGVSVDILFAIAESIRIDTGEMAGDTSAEIGDLYQKHQDSCGG